MCARCDTLGADLTAEVMLAAAERELIFVQADAGESVPGAIRPLSGAERRAKMRFSEIEALEQAAAAEAAKLLASNAQVYIRAVISAIFGAADAVQPAAVVDALEALNRSQPDDVIAETARAQKVMSTILGQVYAGAGLIVIGEAKRQGVKKTPKPLAAETDRFDLLAKAVALHPWTRLTSKLQADMMNPVTLMKTALAAGDPILRADVQKALEAIPLDGAEDLARQTIHTAHGAGRTETAETMAPDEIYSSELLDGETCDACAKVDGKDYDTMAEAKTEYEAGGYGACKGGARCRGTLVFQYNALGTDAPPPAPPALKPGPSPIPALQTPEPKPAPKPVDPAATAWGRRVLDAKKQLPADPSKLGYRTETPDLKKLVAEERARIIAQAGADLPELKKRAAELTQKLAEWDAIYDRFGYSSYPPSKWPADLLPLARKHGLSRKSPKTAAAFIKDARRDLWEMNMDAGSAVAQLEHALGGVEDYVKKYKMRDGVRRVDDLTPEGTLNAETAKALTAVLDAGEALDDQLQARIAARMRGLTDPMPEYRRIADEIGEIWVKRAAADDIDLFAALTKQMNDLQAELDKLGPLNRQYLQKKALIRAEEAKAMIAEVRAVGGGARPVYTKHADTFAGYDGQAEQAMTLAHSYYPDDWNDRVTKHAPTVRLGVTDRGYNASGNEIMLSSDAAAVGPGGEFGHVAVHELGHSMENAIPGLSNLEWAFHYYRSDKIKRVDGAVELKAPFDMYGTGRELSYADKWADDYTGKSYRARSEAPGALESWEIFQTGIESLFEGSKYFDRDGSLGDDAEFRRFILGVLSVL